MRQALHSKAPSIVQGKVSFPLFLFILIHSFLFVACSHSPKEESFGQSKGGAIDLNQSTLHPAKPGDKVPDFELIDSQGKLFRLSEFKENYIFLNFWATWCPPCIEELPSMDALNFRFRTKALTMIAVSVDENWNQINDFLTQLNRKPSFLILHDPGKLVAAGLYGTEKFPETYLIGPDLRLIKKYEGAYPWSSSEIAAEIGQFIQSSGQQEN